MIYDTAVYHYIMHCVRMVLIFIYANMRTVRCGIYTVIIHHHEWVAAAATARAKDGRESGAPASTMPAGHLTVVSIDYRCEDRKKDGELRCEIGIIR
jgi:hypothetical protein